MGRTLAVLLLLLTLTGCLPLSVNSLSTGPDDAVWDEALLGMWSAHPDDHGWGVWVFEPDEDHPSRYRLSIVDEHDRVAEFRATMVDLDGRRFLDLEPLSTDPEPEMSGWFALHLLPMRSFLRITVVEQGVAIAFCDYDALDALLRAEPDAVAHTRITNEAAKDRLVFTADSADLQAFVRDRLFDETFFDDGRVLAKMQARAPAEETDAPTDESGDHAVMFD